MTTNEPKDEEEQVTRIAAGAARARPIVDGEDEEKRSDPHEWVIYSLTLGIHCHLLRRYDWALLAPT